VPTEAKYEMDKGKLALTVYTLCQGLRRRRRGQFLQRVRRAMRPAAAWTPDKEVFADLKHIARSAQYHTLLSMTKMTIPANHPESIGAGNCLSFREKRKFRNGKAPFSR